MSRRTLPTLSSAKLKYIRLIYSSSDPLHIAPIYFGTVETLLVLDVEEVKTYTRVHRHSMDAPHVYNVDVPDPKWLQWWEPAEEDILNAGEHDMYFLIMTVVLSLSIQGRKALENQT